AKARAIACPMPRPPPVTSATRPESLVATARPLSADLGGFREGLARRHRDGAAARRIRISAAGLGVVLARLALEHDADRLDVRNLVLRQLPHALLAGERGRDERRELFVLALDARVFARLQLRHHLLGEQLHRLADMLVPVHAGLLDEDHLVDADIRVALEMLA